MSRKGSCWEVLGIAPTDDNRAIRVAYAAKLKTIDPEADPQAFIALREAFESAQAEARWADLSVRDEAVPPEAETVHAFEQPASPDQLVDAFDAHARALSALLHAEDPRHWLSPEDKTAALAHWRAMTGDPRMEDIAYFNEFERWAAWLIVTSAPRSAPLTAAATRFFHWADAEGTITQSRAVAEITGRFRVLQFLDESQQPNHPHRQAWVELMSKAYPGQGRGRVDPRTVFDVLTAVRYASPETENHFNPLRVEMWKNNTADPDSIESRIERGEVRAHPLFLWGIGGWIALIILSHLAGLVR